MRSIQVFLAIALLATVIGCQPQSQSQAANSTVPEKLLGVWKTSHSKYADRFIEIKKDVIIFGQGGEKIELHALADIHETWEGKSILYTISHLNHEGQRYTFAFYYDPTDGGTIRFKNQPDIIWIKEKR